MQRQLGFSHTALGLVVAALGFFGSACSASLPPAAEMAPPPPMAPAEDTAAAASSEPAPGGMAQLTAPSPGSVAPSTAPAVPSVPAAKQAKTTKDEPKIEDGQKPLLIYQGALGLEVPKNDFPATLEKAIDVAESLGGFILTRSDTSVELRVPSGEFRNATRELGKLGSVTRRSVSTQDVSEEFHDLGVRLKNLESVRNRLEQLLNRTANVDEALRVGKELEAVAGQIDQIKGRMQFLKARATYSLITLTLTPKPESATVVAKDTTPPPARPARMPVGWLKKVGLDGLLDLGPQE
jgi:hypothetical protein